MNTPLFPDKTALAYLVSEYPATSHTFILQEVIGLRNLGFRITTASLNADARPLQELTAEERVERGRTRVELSYTWEGKVTAMESLYDQLAAARRRDTQ